MYIAIPINGGLDSLSNNDTVKIKTEMSDFVITEIKSDELIKDLEISDHNVGIKLNDDSEERLDCYFRPNMEMIVKDSDFDRMTKRTNELISKIEKIIGRKLRPRKPDTESRIEFEISVYDDDKIESVHLYLDGKIIKSWEKGGKLVYKMDKLLLEGEHVYSVIVDENKIINRHIFYLKDFYDVLIEYDVNGDGKIDGWDKYHINQIFDMHGAEKGLTDPSRVRV